MTPTEIKNLVTLESMFRFYGSSPDATGKRWRCLFSANHHNGDCHHSVDTKNGRAKCWSQGCFGERGVDVFSLVGLMEGLTNFADQKRRVCEIGGLTENSVTQARKIIRCYRWEDTEGRVAWHLRWEPGKPKFTWSQDPHGKQPGLGKCKPILRNPDLLMVASIVILCAGERDQDTVNQWLDELRLSPDFFATTPAYGESDVKAAYLQPLFDKPSVYLTGDNDKAGQAYIQKCGQILQGKVEDLRILKVPEGWNDWTDWQAQGGTAVDFQRLLDTVGGWEASPEDAEPTSPYKPDDRGVIIRLRSFDEITPEPVEFAWRGHIVVRAVNLLVGEPDRGKSTIALDLAAKWTTGDVEGDWRGKPVHVLIASCEDSASTIIRPRLDVAGADLSKVHELTFERDAVTGGLCIPEDLPQLEAEMLEVGARVILIDPVMGHLGNVDSYKDQNIRKALGPLASLAERVNGVVLGIMHLNKRDCSSIVLRIGGSVGFVAAARSVLLAAQDPESEDQGNGVLVHAKCNVAPHAPTIRYQIESANYDYEGDEIKTSRIVWGSEAGHIHVGDVLRPEVPGSDEPGQKAEAKEWLLALLENGARPSKEVFKLGENEGGFSKSTLKRAKKDLKIDAKREGFGESGHWVWTLREGDAKGGQNGSKGDHAQEGEPLCESRCKKSQKSNDLPKEGQGSATDTLSQVNEPLSKAAEEPTWQKKNEVVDVDA